MKDKNKKILWSVIGAIGLVLILVIWNVIGIFSEYFSDSPYNGKSVYITVEAGDTIDDIADKLKEAGVIDSKLGFKLRYKWNIEDYGTIQQFDEPFCIYKGNTNDDILIRLTRPKSENLIKVTIPEGFSVDMIALRMQNNSLCTVEDFILAVQDVGSYNYEFIKYIPDGNYKYKLEGFLFPSTYEFKVGVTAHEIVDLMLARFEAEYAVVSSSYDTLFKNITVASLVEREAALDSERATISGVILNRLNQDMLLQIDASAVYAASNGMYDIEDVNGETVKVDSVYNTYLYKGLPPGPICNPSIKSIIAAANPQNHGYVYYHTDTTKNDGSHIFSETYDEHVATMN